MKNNDFTTTFTVEQTREEAFAAINNVRGWWSEEIEGNTDKLGEEFKYRFRDVHRCTMKITELVPGKKVVWLVVDNHFSFTNDETEWQGNEITFEVAENGDKTEVQFIHAGLVPDYECYDVCSNAWGFYINGSLRGLITTGKGQPNAGHPITHGEQAAALEEKSQAMKSGDYTTTFTVDQSPDEAFAAINNVRGWWSGEIEGSTDKLGEEFTYRHGDLHYSRQKISELIPGKKVAWLVLDANLAFVEDKSEWKNTRIEFEIAPKGDKTEVRFTHVGLVPEYECFTSCSDAWGSYINGSLPALITTGKGWVS